VRDAREHGVEVRPPDINASDYDATLEPGPAALERLHPMHHEMAGDIRATHAIRLGLREIKGLSEEDAKLIVERRHSSLTSPYASPSLPPLGGVVDARSAGGGGFSASYKQANTPSLTLPRKRGREKVEQGGREPAVPGEKQSPYDSVRDLWLRTGLASHVIERLADADAFGSLGLSRRDALWAVKALGRTGDHEDLPLFRVATTNRQEPDVALRPMPLGEQVVNDYRFLKLSLRAHPSSFLRADLTRRRIIKNEALRQTRNGARVSISGLITVRQRPGTAKGVIFMTIEDETAVANVIVWPKIFERFRAVVLGSRYVAVSGPMQAESGVIHVVAEHIGDLTPMLARLTDGGTADDLDVQARATRHVVAKKRWTA
jgi:error-prone DNA polymerase